MKWDVFTAAGIPCTTDKPIFYGSSLDEVVGSVWVVDVFVFRLSNVRPLGRLRMIVNIIIFDAEHAQVMSNLAAPSFGFSLLYPLR
jgi:hypothetical protein